MEDGGLFLLVLPERVPFPVGPSREGTSFKLVLVKGVPLSVGSKGDKGVLGTSSGLGCRIPKMLGPYEGQPHGKGGGPWTHQLQVWEEAGIVQSG